MKVYFTSDGMYHEDTNGNPSPEIQSKHLHDSMYSVHNALHCFIYTYKDDLKDYELLKSLIGDKPDIPNMLVALALINNIEE